MTQNRSRDIVQLRNRRRIAQMIHVCMGHQQQVDLAQGG
jgi:hypothetical protein